MGGTTAYATHQMNLDMNPAAINMGSKRTWDDMQTASATSTSTMNPFNAAFGDVSGLGSNGHNGTRNVGAVLIDDNASAASRQKSCNACVRGKRKCDKRTPQCSRCSAKGLDCVYQKLPPGSARSSSPNTGNCANGNNNESSSATSASDSAKPPCTAPVTAQASRVYPSASTASSSCVSDMPEFDMGFDMDSLGTATETSPESLHDNSVPLGGGAANGGLDFSIVELMAGSGGEQDLWNLHTFSEPGSKMDIPPLTMPPHSSSHEQLRQTHQHQQQQIEQQLQLQPIRDLELIKDADTTCMDIDPVHVHDPTTRVGYIMAFLNSMHSTFSRTRALPFMHPRLWADQLPKTILSAFSASSAYATHTTVSKGWTVRLLMDSAREIHREGERASTNTDKLARVQAMLILNSMRIFDGDIALRAAAEREMHVFLNWVTELNDVRNELEADYGLRAADGLVREKPPKTWDSWLFLECTRRSILTASCIMCLVHMLKGDSAKDGMWCEENTFTASRHLWDATTSAEFYRAWREKPQFLINDFVFKEFWMYGQPDDCDEFTRLMLTASIGVDAAENFMTGDTMGSGQMTRGP